MAGGTGEAGQGGAVTAGKGGQAQGGTGTDGSTTVEKVGTVGIRGGGASRAGQGGVGGNVIGNDESLLAGGAGDGGPAGEACGYHFAECSLDLDFFRYLACSGGEALDSTGL